MKHSIDSEELTDRDVGNERKRLSEPPIDVLFNPSLVLKRDAWDIDVASMLKMLLEILERIKYKDLRLCGVAALSSSIIHRIKVESIFRLQTISEQKRRPASQTESTPVENLVPISIPFRHESSYPVSLQDLLSVLEKMISDLADPKSKRTRINLEPVEEFSFDDYFVKIEEILANFEEMVYNRLAERRTLLFSSLIVDMDLVSSARCFLAMLYLAMKGSICVEQTVDMNDISMSIKNDGVLSQ
jgi:segregation and condensation protein A